MKHDTKNFNKTIEVEFKDLLRNIAESKRSSFHLFTIHRILSLGLLNDFDFSYICNEQDKDKVNIKLNLKDFGVVVFCVDINTNYVTIPDKVHMGNIRSFVNEFDKFMKEKGQVDRVF